MSEYKNRLRAGDELRRKLELLGISQGKLASHIGVSEGYLSDVIRSRRRISPVMALKLERAIGLSAGVLLSIQRDADLAAVDPSEYRRIRRI